MGEVLHAGALLPAAVGACCAVGSGRSGRVTAGVSAVVMLLAMLDVTTRILGVPVFAWAALLVFTALAAALAARLTGTGGRAPERQGREALHGGVMALHAAIGLIVAAALFAVMGAGAGTDAGTGGIGIGVPMAGGSPHHGGGASGSLLMLAGLGAVAYLVFSAVLASRLPRVTVGERLAVLEVSSMAASTALMLAAALV